MEGTGSVSLVTSSRGESAQYHLLELTPEMVKYFEADHSRTSKRRRPDDDEGNEEEARGSR